MSNVIKSSAFKPSCSLHGHRVNDVDTNSFDDRYPLLTAFAASDSTAEPQPGHSHHSVWISGKWRLLAEQYREDGQTVMSIAVDGKAAGLIGVADPIKTSTPKAIP